MLPGLDRYLTTEPDDAQNTLAPDYEAEQEREHRWASFEQDVLNFAESEPDGFAAVLRVIARAMREQRHLPYRS